MKSFKTFITESETADIAPVEKKLTEEEYTPEEIIEDIKDHAEKAKTERSLAVKMLDGHKKELTEDQIKELEEYIENICK